MWLEIVVFLLNLYLFSNLSCLSDAPDRVLAGKTFINFYFTMYIELGSVIPLSDGRKGIVVEEVELCSKHVKQS